jgi:hypothetical protein
MSDLWCKNQLIDLAVIKSIKRNVLAVHFAHPFVASKSSPKRHFCVTGCLVLLRDSSIVFDQQLSFMMPP